MADNPNLQVRQFYRAAPARRDEAASGPASGEGESGPGVYLTDTRENARRYLPGYQAGSLFSVTADVRNPLVRRPDTPGDPGERVYTEMRQAVGYGKPDTWHSELARRGYDAIEKYEPLSKHPYEIAVHPDKIRDVSEVEQHEAQG